MEETSVLLDSNIIIYSSLHENSEIRKYINKRRCFASKISLIEVLGYSKLSVVEQNYSEKFFSIIDLIDIDDIVIYKAIDIRKTLKISLGDAIVSASALINNLTLITKNIKDFQKIESIKVINPFE